MVYGYVSQITAVVLYELSYISKQVESHFVVLSFLSVAVAFLFISKIIPDKIKILKYILYLWALIAISANIVYWLIYIIQGSALLS